MKRKYKIAIGAGIGVVLLLFLLTFVGTGLVRRGNYEITLRYGLMLLGFCAVAFLVWKAFIKNSHDELRRSEKRSGELQGQVEELKRTIAELDRELSEKTRSRLNVMELNPILHIAVLNVDTSFTRTYVREEGDMTFNGALRVEICAEYGARLEDARFRYEPWSNTLTIAGFKPGLISYSKKQLNWDIARSYRSRPNILGIERSDVSDQQAEIFTNHMCESLRAELEREIDSRHVAEFDWLSPLISQQVIDIFRLMIGREAINVVIREDSDDAFVDLPTFRAQILEYGRIQDSDVLHPEPVVLHPDSAELNPASSHESASIPPSVSVL